MAAAPKETSVVREAMDVFLLTVHTGPSSSSQVVFTDEIVAQEKQAHFYDMGCEVSLRKIRLDPHLETK